MVEPTAAGRSGPVGATLRYAPGLLLAVMIVGLAQVGGWTQSRLLGQQWVEPLVLALLIGVLLRNVMRRTEPFAAGTRLASALVLEIAVALLGAMVDLRMLADVGPKVGAVVVVGVIGTIAVGIFVGRALRLSRRNATLVGVGNGVCGNSAIAAIAPVIGATRTEVASSIGLTAVIGVGLVLALPLTIPLLSLDDLQYGVLAGMSVYAVPQVVAAAFPVSELSGEIATIVKLARVMLLGPIVLAFAMIYRRRRTDDAARRGVGSYIPWFIVIFLLLATLRSTGLLPLAVADVLGTAAGALTLVAMAGLGFGVDLRSIRSTGPRVAAAVLISLLFLITLTLVMIFALDISV